MKKLLESLMNSFFKGAVLMMTCYFVSEFGIRAFLLFCLFSIIYFASAYVENFFGKKEAIKAESNQARQIFIKSLLTSLVDGLSDICHNVEYVENGEENYSITFRLNDESDKRIAIQRVVMPDKGHYTNEDMVRLIQENLNIAKNTIGLD